MNIRTLTQYALLPWLLLLFLLAATPALAEEKGKRFNDIVDLKFVEQYAVIPRREDVAIIDARPKSRKYDKGHIPGAISIPDRTFDQHTAMLPGKKDTLLIFYCGGQKCMLSHNSAYKAEKLGYTNVKVFADGYPAWIKAGNVGAVSEDYVKKVVDGKAKGVVVDARPKKRKYDKGHIPGALSIPDRQFDELAGTLPQDKSTPLIFYCGGYKCALSHKSAAKAQAAGYKNVKVFAAGFPAWKKSYADLVEKGDGAAKKVAIKQGAEQGTISIESLKAIISDDPESIMLVDVRDAVQYKAGTLPNAVNIPIDDLEKKIASLPKDKPIVFFCNTGGMSGEAYDIVTMLRDDIKAYFVEAEITFKGDGKFEMKPIVG